MSKVQCPMSHSKAPEAAAAKTCEAADLKNDTQGEEADVGHWTSDIGLPLTVTDLRKNFTSPSGERIDVLRGVTFSAGSGETVAIMGSSGAGKSTLLHLLGGLETADHGSIVAGQFAIDNAHPSALARFRNRRVGFVFQFHHLLPDLTAAENVGLPLMIHRRSMAESLQLAAARLKEVGLAARTSHLVGHLSGGEQQRVAVCRALVNRPSIVLADEPTGNLDTAIGDEIARALISYARDNRALVIMATHNRTLAGLCDRTLVLTEGRLSKP